MNLQSSKFTEKIYRLVNRINEIPRCKICNNVLKFYTYSKGYGNSDKNVCINCNTSHNGGVSKISQLFFDEVYKNIKIGKNDICKYYKLNNEEVVKINYDIYMSVPENLRFYTNKNRYVLDFLYNKKIIEFDGDYFHNIHEKELAKDYILKNEGYDILHVKYSEYIKNPNETLQKCLNFLNQ